jgi:hypothetical protein
MIQADSLSLAPSSATGALRSRPWFVMGRGIVSWRHAT